MPDFVALAQRTIECCRLLAQFSEEPGFTTRTFLSEPMREVHALLAGWMAEAGMTSYVDPVGNLRARYSSPAFTDGANGTGGRTLYIGSHLDTVPHAGAFDGVLGVVMGVALVESLEGARLPFEIEVVGFSEEEGVRFGVPFIGSRAFAGDRARELLSLCDRDSVSVADAIRRFGLDPDCIDSVRASEDAIGYLEFHIEQGPVLEDIGAPLGVVQSIVGQSRLNITFTGRANHAGTTPMHLRKDALAAAAQWIGEVERIAQSIQGLVATIGRLEVSPGSGNVIPGKARGSLDVRHAWADVRRGAVEQMTKWAREIAARREIVVEVEPLLDQAAVALDASLTSALANSVKDGGFPVHRMTSGAGHDAMIVAKRMPTAMLFLRSPGGISHHPDENVLPEDVAAALRVGAAFLRRVAHE